MKLNSPKAGVLLIAPSVLLICSLLVYPVLYGVWLSLFKKHSFFPDQRFAGIANYVYLIKNSEFWMSIWYGTVYSVRDAAEDLPQVPGPAGDPAGRGIDHHGDGEREEAEDP